MGVARGDPHNQLSVAIIPPWAAAQRRRRTTEGRRQISRRPARSPGPKRVVHAHANNNHYTNHATIRAIREKEEREAKKREGEKTLLAGKGTERAAEAPGRAQTRVLLVYINPALTSTLLRGVAHNRRYVVPFSENCPDNRRISPREFFSGGKREGFSIPRRSAFGREVKICPW